MADTFDPYYAQEFAIEAAANSSQERRQICCDRSCKKISGSAASSEFLAGRCGTLGLVSEADLPSDSKYTFSARTRKNERNIEVTLRRCSMRISILSGHLEIFRTPRREGSGFETSEAHQIDLTRLQKRLRQISSLTRAPDLSGSSWTRRIFIHE